MVQKKIREIFNPQIFNEILTFIEVHAQIHTHIFMHASKGQKIICNLGLNSDLITN